MLAIAEARRLAEEGRRVLLTCNSAPLARRLADALRDTPGVDVRTYDAVTGDPQFEDRAPTSAGGGPWSGSCDAVVVDEAQDLGDTWRELVESCLTGGVEEGTWRLFHDPAQHLVGAPVDVAATLPASAMRMRLTLNCRNTRQIAVVASMLTRTDLDVEAPVLGPEVVTRWWDDHRAHDAVLSAEMSVLASSLPRGRIAVLTRAPMSEQRRAELRRTSNVPLTRLSIPRSDAVVVATWRRSQSSLPTSIPWMTWPTAGTRMSHAHGPGRT
jgi:hypothetical protein